MSNMDVTDACSICLLKHVNYTTGCNHKFHLNCLEMWLGYKNNCPMCRGILPEVNEEDGVNEEGGGVENNNQRIVVLCDAYRFLIYRDGSQFLRYGT